MRAYLDGMSRLPQPVKVWYCQSHFRYNAVQRGRYREHYQFGVEVVGSRGRGGRRRGDRAAAPLVPAMRRAGAASGAELDRRRHLPPGLRRRCSRSSSTPTSTSSTTSAWSGGKTNPLRVLDCKNPACQAVLAAAPRITDHLCDDCARPLRRGAPPPRRPRGGLRAGADAGARPRLLHAHRLGVERRRPRPRRSRAAAATTAWPSRSAGRPRPASASAPGSSGCSRWCRPAASRGRRRRAVRGDRRAGAARGLFALMDEARAAGCDGGRRLRRPPAEADARAGRASEGDARVVIVGDDEWERERGDGARYDLGRAAQRGAGRPGGGACG